ncbi:MAG: hypothetical protein LBT26_03695 [Clostridiales Family XIII bacterium]|nr:hypothetical protein [Clostridiales Family XIII bacterium]
MSQVVNFNEAANGYDKKQVDAYLEKITNEYQNVYNECVSLQEKQKSLSAENMELKESFQVLMLEKSDVESEVSRFQAELEQARADSEKLTSELDILADANARLSESAEDYKNADKERVASLEAEKNGVEAHADRLRAEFEALKTENLRLKEILTQQPETGGDVEALPKGSISRSRFDAITAAYLSLTEEKVEAKALLSILQKENDELKNENVHLTANVEKNIGAQSEVISKVLLDAELMSNQIIVGARDKSASIVQEAKTEYEQIFSARKRLLDEINGIQQGLQSLITDGNTFDSLYSEEVPSEEGSSEDQ